MWKVTWIVKIFEYRAVKILTLFKSGHHTHTREVGIWCILYNSRVKGFLFLDNCNFCGLVSHGWLREQSQQSNFGK